VKSGAPADAVVAPPEMSDGLAVATPEAVHLRTDALRRLLETAGADRHRDLMSILVARRGRLVVEAYFGGAHRESAHDVRSVAKSVTGTLVGVAVREGSIQSVDAPVLEVLANGRRGRAGAGKEGVTIRHLLEMRSGLDADEDDPSTPGAEDRMEASQDWLRFALGVPMAAAPGGRWAYASVNTVLLGHVVSSATGRDLGDYAEEKLFGPLGFRGHRWRRGPQGEVAAQGNLSVRPRDLVKLGLLFLQRGQWRDRQLVPRRWIDEATRPRTLFERERGGGYGELYKGYACHWWTGEAEVGARAIPFYFASGNGGQRLFVIPDMELLVAITSSAYGQFRAHRRSHAILREVLGSAGA
jgi:CubicO group peptidase (beta-lactamase class C family)